MRGSLVLLAGFLGASPLPAQDGFSAIESALQLARDRQTERAEEACKQILGDPRSTPLVKAAIDLVRAESLLTEALLQSDLKRLQDLIDDSITLLQVFLKNHGSHPLATDARRALDWRRHKKAERVASAARTEGDARRQAELQERALELYAGLEVYYQDRIRELRAAKTDADLQNELMEVLLDIPKAMLERSRLAGMDEERKKRILGEAIERLQDFQLDYCDNAIAFEACWIEGQCHAEMGDFGMARSRYRSAIGLRSRLAQAKIEPNDYCLGIVRGAHVSLAEGLLRAGQYGETVSTIDRALSEEKSLEGKEAGNILKLLKAECLFQMEDLAGAEALAAEVVSADPDGNLGAMAKEKVKAWSSDPRAKGSAGAPERVLALADSFMEKEQWLNALQALRRSLDLCRTPEDRERHHPGIYYKMGQCFSRVAPPRNHEAAIAFESLFTLFPGHDLAPRACFQAIRCLSNEFSASGDKRDDDLKEKLLALLAGNWPDHPSSKNVLFLKAEKAEKAREFKQAAELYLDVPEDAEAHEVALVGAARCYYEHASASWDREGSSQADKAEAKSELEKAEKTLEKFFGTTAGSAQVPAELVKLRDNLTFLATQQLARIQIHQAISKNEECLRLLDGYAKNLQPNDERLLKVWALQIRAHLSLKQVDESVRLLEAMLERFRDHQLVLPSCKTVAIHLQNTTEELIEKKGDPAAIHDNLERISKYYLKWLNDGVLTGRQRVTLADAVSVGDALYTVARRLNRLDDKVDSFLDLNGEPVKERQHFSNAAFVLTLLVEGKLGLGKLKEKDRIDLLKKLGRSYSFIAANLQDWQKASTHYSAVLSSSGVLDASDNLDASALQANASLLSVYIELGAVYYELAKRERGQGFQFDNALKVFRQVGEVTKNGSEPWWISRYLTLAVFFERGAGSDARLARTLLENLEKNYPDYDRDEFRIKGRLLELKAKLLKVTGTGSPR